jgi:rhamnosyltransferase
MGTRESPAVADFAREALAVLVLYGRTLGESVTFRSLEEGLRRLGERLDLLVYDNSAIASHPDPAAGWRIEYRHDPSNPGVSRAYLEGARVAAERGKRWLLLLDQDTCFPSEAITVYADALRRYPTEVLFAPVLRAGARIVSPCAYRFPRGRPLRTTATGLQNLAGKSVLNSGMCVSVAAYLDVGGHDPRIGRYASPGGLQSALGAAMVVGRACRLAVRHRHSGFLRIAASTLIGGADEH